MTQIHSPHALHVAPAPHSASVVQVESSKLIPYLILTVLLAGAAIMCAFWAMHQSNLDEREVRLLQLKVDDMRVALIAKGISPNPHHDGDSP